jgi:Aldolase/RraA
VDLDPTHCTLANLFYEAVGDEPAGKVIVLASNGYTDTSMGGGTKLLRLQEHGCAGVLTDGRLRDFDELTRYDFAAYCSGEANALGRGQRDAISSQRTGRPRPRRGVARLPRGRRHWAPEDISVPKSTREERNCDYQALDTQARERTELQRAGSRGRSSG